MTEVGDIQGGRETYSIIILGLMSDLKAQSVVSTACTII